MKILSTEETRTADRETILAQSIKSIDLMEFAAEKCCEFFPPVGEWNKLVVICGTGNNGGDGLAIARMQLQNYKSVRVLVLENKKKRSENFSINLEKLQNENANIHFISEPEDLYIGEDELVVDAIFGVGLNRPVDEFTGKCIDRINAQASYIISIDLPSGLFADAVPAGSVIRSDLTLTIGAPKQILFFQESAEYVGEWQLVEIYPDNYVERNFFNSPEIVDLNSVKNLIRKRPDFSHKGTFGKALLVSGSQGKYGAAILASRACMRSGVGLLTVQVPSDGVNLIHAGLPEAILKSDKNQHMISDITDHEMYDAIGIGPGIGVANETVDALMELIKVHTKPIVLDADALNVIGEHPELLGKLPVNSILTPHPKEFERMFGPSENSFDRLEKQKKHSGIHKLIIVCKCRYTTITTPQGKVFVNTSGNSGLAKGGSGDVLTGIITALLAQGYSSEHAAVLGVFIHGHSADLLTKKMHPSGILPSDVIENLPFALKDVVENRNQTERS